MSESTTGIDVLLSNGYVVDDTSHPIQEIMYGVKVVNGIPTPVVVRRDANTKEILQDYSPAQYLDQTQIQTMINTAMQNSKEVYVGDVSDAPDSVTLIAVPTETS
jgi:hypothetical protein